MEPMSCEELKEKYIDPTLKAIDRYDPRLSTVLAITCAQESDMGKYVKQLGNGPARGIYQCEPATFHDVIVNYLVYHKDLKHAIESFCFPNQTVKLESLDADILMENHYLATAIAACSFMRHHQPDDSIDTTDPTSIYKIYKKYYNGPGAATLSSFVNSWNTHKIS